MFGHGVSDDVKSSGLTKTHSCMTNAGVDASKALAGLPDDILLEIFSFVDVETIEALLQVRPSRSPVTNHSEAANALNR